MTVQKRGGGVMAYMYVWGRGGEPVVVGEGRTQITFSMDGRCGFLNAPRLGFVESRLSGVIPIFQRYFTKQCGTNWN